MGLVRQSAIELARPNEGLKIKYPIRVNAVSPTFAETNLTKHIKNMLIFGVPVIVSINRFYTDHDDEIKALTGV